MIMFLKIINKLINRLSNIIVTELVAAKLQTHKMG